MTCEDAIGTPRLSYFPDTNELVQIDQNEVMRSKPVNTDGLACAIHETSHTAERPLTGRSPLLSAS